MDQEKLGLGKIILDSEYRPRDAVHIAIAPVSADTDLWPGTRLKLVTGTTDRVEQTNIAADVVGIADPFLPLKAIKSGQKFWLYLLPGSISSLRHDWTHPAFLDIPLGLKPSASLSESWLRVFAECEAGISYQELMDGAKAYLENEEYLIDEGKWEGFSFNTVEFWKHYERVTGVHKPDDMYGHFFSCAC